MGKGLPDFEKSGRFFIFFMVTAFGDTIDPGKVNAWMKGRSTSTSGGFTENGGVSWYAPEKHDKKMKLIDPNRKKMFSIIDSVTAKGKKIKVKRLNLDTRSNPSQLDRFLLQCNLIIVSVYNSKTRNEHWVIVTGKEKERYTIIDPGDRNQRYLDEYGDFWSYMVYRKESE